MLYFFIEMEKKYKTFEYILLLTAGFISIFMVLLTTLDVIMRNLLNKPLAGVYEIVNLLIIGFIVLGLSYTQGYKEHIVVDIATNKLPKLYIKVLELIGYIIGLFFISIIAWQTSLEAVSSFTKQEYTLEYLKIQLWPTKTIISLGMTTFAIRLLIDVLISLLTLKSETDLDKIKEI